MTPKPAPETILDLCDRLEGLQRNWATRLSRAVREMRQELERIGALERDVVETTLAAQRLLKRLDEGGGE